MIDPLEERQLLSLTADVTTLLISDSQNVQSTVGAQSVATDNNGDTVAVWTATDTVYDAELGTTVTDLNVYAKYLTNEVQRLTLSSEVVAGSSTTTYSKFALIYGTSVVSTLSITATNPQASFSGDVAGTFKLTFGSQTTGDISFSETAFGSGTPGVDPALNIQAALRSLGGDLENVVVKGVDAHTYQISYEVDALAYVTSTVTPSTVGIDQTSVAFADGYLPAVQISLDKKPELIGGYVNSLGDIVPQIAVSSTDPAKTILSIQNAFARITDTTYTAPSGETDAGALPASTPVTTTTPIADVTVTSVQTTSDPKGLWTFNITFNGDAGKQIQSELQVAKIVNKSGAVLNPSIANVAVVKQSSEVFRVNPDEPDDPFTVGLDLYDQQNASVAMDADGDFVITWDGEVPDTDNMGSVSDIFARRFSPIGMTTSTIAGQILATEVQRLTFQAVSVPIGGLTGTFQLMVSGSTSINIYFDSNDLGGTSTRIQEALIKLGYKGTTVSVVKSADSTRFQFDVTFNGQRAAGKSATIEYVANPTTPLPIVFGNVLRNVWVNSVLGLKAPSVDNLTRVDDYTFRVNTLTANAQEQPSIAMDDAGNFVVSWNGVGQYSSFFNGIYVRRFTADGKPVDVEYEVSDDNANAHMNSYVALSYDGHVGVAWESYDPMLQTGGVEVTWIDARIYDEKGNLIVSLPGIGTAASDPSISFDLADNFVIAWAQRPDVDSIITGPAGGPYSVYQEGVLARLYSSTGALIQSTFRANSATLDPSQVTSWSGYQGNPQVAIDADGDITIVYEGYGADASVYTYLADSYFAQVMALAENADLVPYMDSASVYAYIYSNWDVGGEIDAILAAAQAEMQGAVIGQVYGSVTSPYSVTPVFSNLIPSATTTTYILLACSSDALPPPLDSILVDSEEMLITNVEDYTTEYEKGGNTVPDGITIYMCTVDRAQSGTAAAAHTRTNLGSANLVHEKPATALTADEIANKLGRMSAILNNVMGMLRGEANGVMFSQFDAQPTYGVTNAITTDAIINQYRDGENQRTLIILDKDITTGNFVVRIYDPYYGDHTIYQDITITPVIDYVGTDVNGDPLWVVNIDKTIKAINDSIETAVAELGKSWLSANNQDLSTLAGPVSVRNITSSEILSRVGTDWELTGVNAATQLVFELTFQGEVHELDIDIEMADGNNGNHLTHAPIPEEQMVVFSSGTKEGWYALAMDGKSSADIWFVAVPDPAIDPVGAEAAMASNAMSIQNAVQTLAAENKDLDKLDPKVYGRVTVLAIDATHYKVTFHGLNAGIDQKPISQGTLAYKPTQGLPDLSYTGSVGSYEITKGDTPKAAQPLLPTETYANAGTTQHDVSIAMQPNGTFVTTWTQDNEYTTGGTSNQSIYFRTFIESTDTAGPIVSGVESASGTKIYADGKLNSTVGLKYLVLDFDEAMYSVGTVDAQLALKGLTRATADAATIADCQQKWDCSVLNPLNYQMLSNGVALGGVIASVQYGLNESYELGLSTVPTNKYQVVLTFDSNQSLAGNQALANGNYTIKVSHPITSSQTVVGQTGLRDAVGNALNLTGYTPGGSDFSMSFSVVTGSGSDEVGAPATGTVDVPVNTTQTGTESSPVVANSPSGSYVVVWTRYGSDGDATGAANIVAQRYTASGTAVGPEFIVNSYTTGSQAEPAVAMDADGGFVVTWSGQGASDEYGIYARSYDASGRPEGAQFRVSKLVANTQDQPSVAVSASGTFIVTWTSYNQDGSSSGRIYGRCYDAASQPLGGEFQVGSTGQSAERSDVAIADDGSSIVVWQSNSSSANGWDIHAQRLDAAGNKIGSEFTVNAFLINTQSNPQVSMDAAGDFVVVWESFAQDGSGWGVFARRFNAAGAALEAGEFCVNQTTANWQYQPDVALDKDGNFTVVWTTYGQDDPITTDYGIYARMYLADGTDYADSNGRVVGEFRVNATTRGDQVTASVCRDADNGDYIVGWVGPNGGGTGIYARRLDPPVEGGDLLVEDSGPEISGVVAVEAGTRDGVLYSNEAIVLSWSAADSDGIASATLSVDGNAISQVNGPYLTEFGANFAASLGTLSAGTHTYAIVAKDKAGNTTSSVYTGSFEVVAAAATTGQTGPKVSGVMVVEVALPRDGILTAADPLVMTWNAVDPDSVASATLYVDGQAMTDVRGPYATISGVNFAAMIGTLAAGTHTYSITATDKLGNVTGTACVGSFEVAASAASVGQRGPVVSGVMVVEEALPRDGILTANDPLVMTWNAVDPDSVASATLYVDGAAMTDVRGPYATVSGVNFAAMIGTLAAGTHTYSITATDKLGNVTATACVGSFEIEAGVAATVQQVSTSQTGPAITNVAAVEYQGNGDGVIQTGEKILISWSLTDTDGIYSTSAVIGSSAATSINGPFGANYSAVFDPQTAVGNFTFAIRATDNSAARTQSEYSGTLSVAQAKAAYFSSVLGSSDSAKTDWLVDLDSATSSPTQSVSAIDAFFTTI